MIRKKATPKCQKEFIRLLWGLFPQHGKRERRFVEEISHSIEDYLAVNPNATFEVLCEQFQSPQELLCDFLREQTSEYLIAQVNRKRIRKVFACFICASLVAALFIFAFFLQKAYLDSKNSILHLEESIIYVE